MVKHATQVRKEIPVKETVINTIQEFVKTYQARESVATRWQPPIVGFASARDPLFERLRDVASPTHALPRDFLPAAKTVISYFFPFEKQMVRTNIKERYASPEWGLGYVETNEMLRHLSRHLDTCFASLGHDSVRIPATHNWDEEKLISDWSHRHVAYIAGLGNFGLNNMLITEKGCCGRVGSFITTADIPADTRSDAQACLYKFDRTCRKCADKCVNDALSPEAFDRFRCYDMLLENVEKLRSVGYADVCGKCLTGLPCSYADPVARKRAAASKGVN